MNFKQLLENKPLLYTIIGVIVVAFALVVMSVTMSAGKGQSKIVEEKKIKGPLILLTTDNIGKAIEIQAVLARQGIQADRALDGTKSSILLTNYKLSERDRALITIVQSGLVDQNVGLEIFDKGDFTSTKEDKRIRLVRAINGELSRLIRKIPPIENASVFISIPEQSMFSSMQKPVTATVQITIPSGEKLEVLKVKAITNLLLGSVTGLTVENIAITDTNGNVYSSIISAEDEMLAKIEENDKYMQQKVNAQLDRLIGKGNYVVTVSTSLKQAPVDKVSILYNPEQKTAVSEQTFSEGLGDESLDNSHGSTPANAVSVYVPNGIGAAGGNNNSASSQNRNYSRNARETQYGVSKTQISEYTKAGVLEDISIAVTIEKNLIPADTTLEELKELIARSASPKVSAENVTIALSDTIEPYLASNKPENLPQAAETGNPWWITIVLVVMGLGGGFYVVSGKMKTVQLSQQKEMQMLRDKTVEQDMQLRDVSVRAADLIERQDQLQQNLIEQQQREQISAMPNEALDEALAAIRSELDSLDLEETGEKIKSWIEQR